MHGRIHCFHWWLTLAVAALTAPTLAADYGSEAAEERCHMITFAAPKTFDQKEGKDPLNYPPDRVVDVKHIKLELVFKDLASKSFEGVETYAFVPIAPGVKRITLNGIDLKIGSVRGADGRTLRFDYDDKKLVIHFDEPLAAGAEVSLRIEYRCQEPVAGLTFVLPDALRPDRVPQVHSQGEAEFNRYWFFCHDFPNERASTEMIVTVPKPFLALSNGELQGKTEHGDSITYHWLQDLPHVSYLVTLVIGQFAEVRDAWRGIPVLYYVRPGEEEDARRSFARTPDMLEFFSQKTGTPYAFRKYAQICVERFGGGMENTSATTLHADVPMDARAALDEDQDGLISHELAHQWFGDLITCKSWAHLWLNEGFADFFADLWLEHKRGADEHSYDLWRSFRNVAASDTNERPGALVYSDYSDADETFGFKGGLPYGKGSALLHMLRHELGEDTFWTGIAEYVKTFREREVETDDFRKVMERVSGRSLVQFFEQWAYRPGVPKLKVEFDWDDDNSMAVITVQQTQKIDRNLPAFAVPLDLYFRCDGQETRRTVQLAATKEVFRRPLPKRPELFCVDPDMGLLKELTVEQPRCMWLTQLAEGPTVATRAESARRLADHNRPEVTEALARCVANSKEFWGVRAEAARSLGRMFTPRARDALLAVVEPPATIEHPKVRNALVDALARYRDPRCVALLGDWAQHDASYSVQTAAIRALPDVEALGQIDLLLSSARTDSYRDRIRQAAISALGELADADPAGLDVCLEIAASAQRDRSRSSAIAALGKFGKHAELKERIADFLLPLLSESDDRLVRAAVDALGELGDERALPPLRTLRESTRNNATAGPSGLSDLREAAGRAVDRITKKQEETKAVQSLRDELEALRKTKDELLERVKTLESRPKENGD
ncbi:MAG TPA: M1 family aminopeptidase [Phycisphaerae bacterium]